MTLDFNQITDNLFVGSRLEGGDWHALQDLGVTVNVNLRDEARDTFDGAQPEVSLWLPTRDMYGPDVATIELGARFIASMVETGRKVYVHCHYGAGRAPIVGAGYLVVSGMDVDEAIRFMKQQRPGFKPNGGQIKNLRAFAEKWEQERGG